MLTLLAMTLVWKFTGLAELATLDRVELVLAAGESGLTAAKFVFGSLIGMLPGAIVATVIGDHVVAFIYTQTFGEATAVLPGLPVYIGFVIVAQGVLPRRHRLPKSCSTDLKVTIERHGISERQRATFDVGLEEYPSQHRGRRRLD